MSQQLKPSSKYQHIYAIVRYEVDADEKTPIDLRVTVKKVVVDPHYAESEVKRLNALNADKSSYYFCQVTRFEDVPVEAQEVTASIGTSWSHSSINGQSASGS